MHILNLTQHPATPDQIEAGVVDLTLATKTLVSELLTFTFLPSRTEIDKRAYEISQIAAELGADQVMIGGAPYLMAPLEEYLRSNCIRAFYAFSQRKSEEIVAADGSVTKIVVFRHSGFVEA
jgi:hypothetical protein